MVLKFIMKYLKELTKPTNKILGLLLRLPNDVTEVTEGRREEGGGEQGSVVNLAKLFSLFLKMGESASGLVLAL